MSWPSRKRRSSAQHLHQAAKQSKLHSFFKLSASSNSPDPPSKTPSVTSNVISSGCYADFKENISQNEGHQYPFGTSSSYFDLDISVIPDSQKTAYENIEFNTLYGRGKMRERDNNTKNSGMTVTFNSLPCSDIIYGINRNGKVGEPGTEKQNEMHGEKHENQMVPPRRRNSGQIYLSTLPRVGDKISPVRGYESLFNSEDIGSFESQPCSEIIAGKEITNATVHSKDDLYSGSYESLPCSEIIAGKNIAKATVHSKGALDTGSFESLPCSEIIAGQIKITDIQAKGKLKRVEKTSLSDVYVNSCYPNKILYSKINNNVTDTSYTSEGNDSGGSSKSVLDHNFNKSSDSIADINSDSNSSQKIVHNNSDDSLHSVVDNSSEGDSISLDESSQTVTDKSLDSSQKRVHHDVEDTSEGGSSVDDISQRTTSSVHLSVSSDDADSLINTGSLEVMKGPSYYFQNVHKTE